MFDSVARLGSWLRPAIEPHITTGAVSQQVRAVQASLGVELVEKRGRQLGLMTANGQEQQKSVASAMGETTGAVQALQAGVWPEEERAGIYLSIPLAEGVEWLTRPLLRFRVRCA